MYARLPLLCAPPRINASSVWSTSPRRARVTPAPPAGFFSATRIARAACGACRHGGNSSARAPPVNGRAHGCRASSRSSCAARCWCRWVCTRTALLLLPLLRASVRCCAFARRTRLRRYQRANKRASAAWRVASASNSKSICIEENSKANSAENIAEKHRKASAASLAKAYLIEKRRRAKLRWRQHAINVRRGAGIMAKTANQQ